MADKKKRPILTPGKPGSSKMGDAIAGMIKDRVNAKVPNKADTPKKDRPVLKAKK